MGCCKVKLKSTKSRGETISQMKRGLVLYSLTCGGTHQFV